MKSQKDFSILKWIVFPLNSLVLSGTVAYFNLTVFGARDGLPYSFIVALIGLFSIVINKYTESTNRNLAKAAFVFEIILTAALVANATYSVSVQRKMSIARMANDAQTQSLERISKLRGSRTQLEALRHIEQTQGAQSAQSVFSANEHVLFLIMAGELALYGTASFTLFAIAKLINIDDEIVSNRFPMGTNRRFDSTAKTAPVEVETDGAVRETVENFPPEIDVESRLPSRRGQLAKTTTHDDRIDDTRSEQITTPTTQAAGLKALRDVLKLIGFSNPPMHFKSDVRNGVVIIRSMSSERGVQHTKHSAKAPISILDDAISMSTEKFRYQLEDFLRGEGFEI